MDIGAEHTLWATQVGDRPLFPRLGAGLDWAGLAARLAAAHALRQATGTPARPAARTGSFRPVIAGHLAGQCAEPAFRNVEMEESGGINYVSSGDLKSASGTIAAVAGPSITGDRG